MGFNYYGISEIDVNVQKIDSEAKLKREKKWVRDVEMNFV